MMPYNKSILRGSFLSRREMLQRTGTGLGMLGLAGLLADAVPAHAANPLAPKPPLFPSDKTALC